MKAKTVKSLLDKHLVDDKEILDEFEAIRDENRPDADKLAKEVRQLKMKSCPTFDTRCGIRFRCRRC